MNGERNWIVLYGFKCWDGSIIHDCTLEPSTFEDANKRADNMRSLPETYVYVILRNLILE